MKLPSLRVLDFSGNPIDSSAESKIAKAFPDLFILNGEALTLTRLLEEISADDFGKSSGTSDDEPLAADLASEHEFGTTDDDDIGVKNFISESTRNLQGWFSTRILVLGCSLTPNWRAAYRVTAAVQGNGGGCRPRSCIFSVTNRIVV